MNFKPVLWLCMIALALVIFPSKQAKASANYKVIRIDSIRVRSAPAMESPPVGRAYWGDWLAIECQKAGGKGGRSQVWNKISSPANGWIPDWYTNTGGNGGFNPRIPRCQAKPPAKPSAQQKAVAWAKAQVGKTKQPNGLWWALWCDRFVANAYGRPNSGYWTAQAHYHDLNRRGLIRRTGQPPAGALVFYSSVFGGHVALSLGNGQVVSTPLFTGRPVRYARQGEFAGYLGWSHANPEWLRR